MVGTAAASRDLPASTRWAWLSRPAPFAAAAAVVLFACALSVAGTAWVYEHFDLGTVQASSRPVASESATATSGTRRTLPAQAMLTILAASFPETDQYARDVRSMTEWLEGSGYPVYYASIDH